MILENNTINMEAPSRLGEVLFAILVQNRG